MFGEKLQLQSCRSFKHAFCSLLYHSFQHQLSRMKTPALQRTQGTVCVRTFKGDMRIPRHKTIHTHTRLHGKQIDRLLKCPTMLRIKWFLVWPVTDRHRFRLSRIWPKQKEQPPQESEAWEIPPQHKLIVCL